MSAIGTVKTVICFKCKQILPFEAGMKIGRSDDCTHCKASLRCCKMCRFYDPKAYNECKEPVAERILDKEQANFCEFFNLSGASSELQKEQDKIMSAAEALFKK